MASDLGELRELAYSRCKGYCEKCGLPLRDNWALHHRKLRKHGGKDEISNVVALHHECHNLGTYSVHLRPKASYESGLLVKSFDDPQTAPVTLPNGSRVILSSDGEY